MVIFSRKGGGRRDDRARLARLTTTTAGWRDPSEPEPEALEIPEFGPYDVAVAPDDDVSRLDLGSLRVPNLPGVAVQVEAAPNGQIVRVQLEHEGTRLQLAAYAAPRTEGIWDDVRDEIRAALLGSGAKVVEVDSDYGPALAARSDGSGGAPATELRHLGIDGPRWFVHAVFAGPGAGDPSRAAPLWAALRGLVVDRGAEARPVKEPLPLRLPAELAARLAEMAARRNAAGPAGAGPSAGADRTAGAGPSAGADRTAASGPPTATGPRPPRKTTGRRP